MLVLATLLGGVTGFLNVVAGGGSLLSLPFLIFLGLDASSANATNRVAILLQNIVAVWQFRKDKALSIRESLVLGIPATIGAVGGTFLAIQLDEKFLKITIALLISLMAVMLIAKPGCGILTGRPPGLNGPNGSSSLLSEPMAVLSRPV